MQSIGESLDLSSLSKPYEGQALSLCPQCLEPTECIVDTPLGERVFPISCKCRRDALKADEDARTKEARYRRAYGYSWRAYSKRTFANDDGMNPELTRKAKSYADNFEKMRKEGIGLIFHGATDKGKTYMAACIANELLDKGHSVIFKSVPLMVSEFQDHAFDSEYLRKLLIGCDLLILDDWGSERDTEFSQEKVYDIVNARYEAMLPMIVTTNHTINVLMKGEGLPLNADRTRARLMERCLPTEVSGNRSRVDANNWSRMMKLLESE